MNRKTGKKQHKQDFFSIISLETENDRTYHQASTIKQIPVLIKNKHLFLIHVKYTHTHTHNSPYMIHITLHSSSTQSHLASQSISSSSNCFPKAIAITSTTHIDLTNTQLEIESHRRWCWWWWRRTDSGGALEGET